MALNIKNADVEALATEIARLTGETKTEAIRKALAERMQRLRPQVDPAERHARTQRYLETEVWPLVPPGERGRRLSRDEEDEILGFGPEGF